MRAVSHRWEIPFSFVFLDFTSTCGEQPLRPVHMIPGQLIALRKLTDPGVNFASVHGLMSVTVHMTFFLCPRATSRGGLPIVQHQVTGLANVIFLHVNRAQKLPGGNSSLAYAYH